MDDLIVFSIFTCYLYHIQLQDAFVRPERNHTPVSRDSSLCPPGNRPSTFSLYGSVYSIPFQINGIRKHVAFGDWTLTLIFSRFIMLDHGSGLCPFLSANNIPLYEESIFCSSLHPVMSTGLLPLGSCE